MKNDFYKSIINRCLSTIVKLNYIIQNSEQSGDVGVICGGYLWRINKLLNDINLGFLITYQELEYTMNHCDTFIENHIYEIAERNLSGQK